MFLAKEQQWDESVTELLTTRLDTRRKVVTSEFKQPCVNCGAEMPSGNRFCSSCGQPLTINVVEVLNSTFRILKNQPVIILPILLYAIPSGLLGVWIYSALPPLFTPASNSTYMMNQGWKLWWDYFARSAIILAFEWIIQPLVQGMYPFMVKEAVIGAKIDLSEAFRIATRKYAPLLLSSTLVMVAAIAGTLLLVVPGLIVALWYYYTFPAIVIEDRGALNGMSASKAFGRRRKWDTSVMSLSAWVPTFAISLLLRQVPFASPTGFLIHTAIGLTFGLVTSVLGSVMTSLAYLTYAMPKTRLATQSGH